MLQWPTLGFKNDPISTDPILHNTLPLYVGHEKEVKTCLNLLSSKNKRIVIEGKRGVGTTSFANYLRFSLQDKKLYFTPRNEIRVDAGWQLETLLSAIVANIVREMEFFASDAMVKDSRFVNAKALSARIAETYRSFGIEAFGVGANYGRNVGVVTQPIFVPAPVLGHHIEDLTALIQESGYTNGLLIQLNNLDVGEIHEERHLKYLFNSLRDYTKTDNVSWLFVGDVGLRKFIAQQVDRLDDIISFEIKIVPLSRENFFALIRKRVECYRMTPKVELPIDADVFMYLYNITKGRLRYIFGLLSRLMAALHIGNINDRITLNIAKSMLRKLVSNCIN